MKTINVAIDALNKLLIVLVLIILAPLLGLLWLLGRTLELLGLEIRLWLS